MIITILLRQDACILVHSSYGNIGGGVGRGVCVWGEGNLILAYVQKKIIK